MFAVLKKELKAYYTSAFSWIYYAMFFLVMGLLFVRSCLTTYSTQFGYYVLSRTFLVTILMVPFCTMRLFAQERKMRTDQLLFTAPVSTFHILAGKYLATVIFVLMPVLISGLYPVYMSAHGEMSVRYLMGTYLAVVLVSVLLLSVGMFLSAITSNMVIAAISSYAVYGVVILGRIIENVVANENIQDVLHNISLYNKYMDMVSGIVRSGDILYLLFLTVGFFFLTWIVLESRRKQGKENYIKAAVIVAGVLVFSFFALTFTKVWDFTAERILSLSDETKKIVSSVEKPTEIYYLGDKSRVNATYSEFFDTYCRLNENITIQYKNVYFDDNFREQYLSKISEINEASILVVCGDKYIYLDSADYISTVWTSAYSYKSMLELEHQLSSAIYYTNSDLAEEVYMIRGHGEDSLTGDFYEILQVNNYVIKDLELAEAIRSFKATFSENCKAVIINSPETDFSEEEIDVLKKYVADGGKIFVSIDPLNEETNRLFAFLKEYGFDIQKGIVIEPESTHCIYETPYYLIPDMEETEATTSLIKDGYQVLTMTSKGIQLTDTNGYTVTELLSTSREAFSKVENFDNLSIKSENDIMGPFSIAAYSEKDNEGAVTLLTSDLFFNEDVEKDSLGANKRFFLNMMNQLTGNETAFLIEGKDISTQEALYPNTAMKFTKLMTIVLIPLFVAVFGMIVIVLYHNNINLSSLKKDRVKKNESEE